MAFQTSRQASSLLSLTLRRPPLGFTPNRQILPSAQQRCIHEEQQYERKQYERRPARLSYTQGERFQNVRPQPRAPIAHRVRKEFLVNDDLEVLDAMYLKLFGKDLGLSEDVKWQAVTHKTFDHGRQPFNSKLKFLGKRLLQTQISIHLLSVPLKGGPKEPKPSVYKSLEGSLYQNPEPFVHEDYKSLENITGARIEGLMSESRLMPLIEEVGLPNVMRWKPAEISDLKRSGQQPVALECLFAITGAVALQKGGDVAVQFIRDRILTKTRKAASASPDSAPDPAPSPST